MAVRYLWLDGVDYTKRVLVDMPPYVSPPELKRQTLNIPGADGVIDVTPNLVYEERTMNIRIATVNKAAFDEIMAKQGQQVRVSVLPQWAGKYWRGRLTLPAQGAWGVEHRTFMDLQVHPRLFTPRQVARSLTASGKSATVSLSAATPTVPTVRVVNSAVELRATVGGAPRVWAVSPGTHRVSGLRLSPTPLNVTVKALGGAADVYFNWEDGELWNG